MSTTIEKATPVRKPRASKAPATPSDVLAIPLTFDDLLAISTTLVAAASDDITPVITRVRLRQSAGRVDATATDRFRVAMVDFPTKDTAVGEGEVLLSRTILAQAISAGKIGNDHKEMRELPTVLLTVETIAGIRHTAIESVRGWRFTETALSGNFPPVEKLFPEDGGTEGVMHGAMLNMAYVADATKVRTPGQVNPAQTDQVWAITSLPAKENGQSGPVLFTQESKTGRARYLLQPNLNTRS